MLGAASERGRGGRPGLHVFVFDHAVSVPVQWDPEGARCLDLSRSLTAIHEQAVGERSKGGYVVFENNNDWPGNTTRGLDTESMTISLPKRKVDEFRAR